MAVTKGTKLLLAHLAGDYLLQPNWMSQRKTSNMRVAATHGAIYALCHLPVTRNPVKLAIIGGTHMIIDRYRLAKHVGWAKNQFAPAEERYPWGEPAKANNGYDENTPAWLSTWLMIIVDNGLHMFINAITTKDDKE